ncbi:MAG: acyltransferase family protein [Candidatus Levybacteria bacterium]|nr:acyltransferase family protein [Candidatus Levybacteria bacterium]
MKNTENAISSRISWIDVCRGIAILFVLYAHVLGSDSYRHLFYAFHMPLFFFLSGIVFKEDYKSFFGLVIKSCKTILVPYFIFACLTYLLWFLKEPSTHNTLNDFIYQIQGIFYGNGNNGYLYFNVALWFLPCLFITKIGFALITKFFSSTKIIIGIIMLFSIAGYVLSSYYSSSKLPFGIETALSAIVFFGVGFLVKRNTHLFPLMMKNGLLLFITGLVLIVIFGTINYNMYGYQIDMRMNRLNNYFLFYAGALSGIVCWVAFSMMIGKNLILEYIGKHTLHLFVWHYLLFSTFNDFASMFVPIDILNMIRFLLPTVYTTTAVGLILGVIHLWRKVIYKYFSSKE